MRPERRSLPRISVYLRVAFRLTNCFILNKVYTLMAEGQQKNTEKLRVFSERLRTRMARLSLQANEVAEKLGVEPSAVSNWMAGKNLAKGENMRKLTGLLECSATWLLGESEDVMLMKEDGPQVSHSYWQRRAIDAERRLENVRNGMRYLIDASATTPTNSVVASEVQEALAKAARTSEERADQPGPENKSDSTTA